MATYPENRLRPEDLPKEPFSYMGSGRTIRSPLGQTIFAVALLLMAVASFAALLYLGVERQDTATIAGAFFMLLMFGGLGTVALVIGVKRLRWKREYTCLTGHSPF